MIITGFSTIGFLLKDNAHAVAMPAKSPQSFPPFNLLLDISIFDIDVFTSCVH